MEHTLTIVGIGPGAREYILPAAQKAIDSAEVLAGGARALLEFSRPHQQTLKVDGDIRRLLHSVRERLAGQDIVVMVSGDPGYFSLLETMRREFGPDCIKVIPGISSFQFAFSRLGLPWQNAKLISAHGRQPRQSELAYEKGRILSLLTDAKNHPAQIAFHLQEQGWPSRTRIWLCRNLSYADETILATSLENALQVSGFDSCVMVVME